MPKSTPIYMLKRKAKRLARQNNIALHQALDTVASAEGFRSWSHLAASSTHGSPARSILSRLEPGAFCLIGARPGQGKTLLGLDLALNAPRTGRKGYVFTLDYNAGDVAALISALGQDPHASAGALVVDTSDDVSADYIIERLGSEREPVLFVVDYLQVLDQRRRNPGLDDQMAALKRFVVETGAICVLISQIDRAFDLGGKAMPDRSDIRLPNPLDLSVFDAFVFLHEGQLQFDRAA